MVFKLLQRLSRHTTVLFLFLAMVVLLVALAVVVLLNSTFQTEVDVEDGYEDLRNKFRDLLSEFLHKPDQERISKHIRDTSKVDQRRQLVLSIDQDKSAKGRNSGRPKLSPLYTCSYFNAAARLCVNTRQLGTTLTIGVRVEGTDTEKYPIHWYRVFKVRGQGDQKSLSFVKFSRANLPWNINLGGDDNELRISPITETDFSYNFFLATLNEGSPEDVQGSSKGHLQLLMFRIEPISVDMGTLYHGEEITINIRSHMELPVRSVQYEWAKIGRDYEPKHNLPSNMKLSRDGSAMIIKEHQSDGDMILTCAIFSNKNFTIGRRNFFLKKIVSAKNPNLKIGNEIRRKRRYLDDFYAQPNWNIGHSSIAKRNSFPSNDIDMGLISETEATEDSESLPNRPPLDLSSFQQTTSQFALVDKSQETLMNFFASTFATETTEMPVFENGRQNSKFPNGLVQQEDDMIEPGDDKDVQEFSTVRTIPQEKPTFEDKESVLIAYCNVDADCGINAVCFHIERTQKFCKCLPHYRGNGLFCWLF